MSSPQQLCQQWRGARDTLLAWAFVSGCFLAGTDETFFVIWSGLSAVGAMACHGIVELLDADIAAKRGAP